MKQERLLTILVAPHMSEKSAIAKDERRQYVFEVSRSANKNEVKQAVEHLFNTTVTSVRIVNVKSKPKRFRNMEGRSKVWKKAYVTLAAGKVIEFSGA